MQQRLCFLDRSSMVRFSASLLVCVVCSMLLVSLNCLLLIASSVFCVVFFVLFVFVPSCAQCCLYLWILYYWLSLLFDVLFLCFHCRPSVCCVLNVACISGLFIIDCPFCFLCCVFCFVCLRTVLYSMMPVSLHCLLLIAPSVFYNITFIFNIKGYFTNTRPPSRLRTLHLYIS